MEKRVSDLKGIIRFFSKAEPGFVVDAKIPAKGAKHDKSYDSR